MLNVLSQLIHLGLAYIRLVFMFKSNKIQKGKRNLQVDL